MRVDVLCLLWINWAKVPVLVQWLENSKLWAKSKKGSVLKTFLLMDLIQSFLLLFSPLKVFKRLLKEVGHLEFVISMHKTAYVVCKEIFNFKQVMWRVHFFFAIWVKKASIY